MRPLRDGEFRWKCAVLECSLGLYPCLKVNGPLTVAFVKPEDVIDHVIRTMANNICDSLGPLGGCPSVLGSFVRNSTNTQPGVA